MISVGCFGTLQYCTCDMAARSKRSIDLHQETRSVHSDPFVGTKFHSVFKDILPCSSITQRFLYYLLVALIQILIRVCISAQYFII